MAALLDIAQSNGFLLGGLPAALFVLVRHFMDIISFKY